MKYKVTDRITVVGTGEYNNIQKGVEMQMHPLTAKTLEEKGFVKVKKTTEK